MKQLFSSGTKLPENWIQDAYNSPNINWRKIYDYHHNVKSELDDFTPKYTAKKTVFYEIIEDFVCSLRNGKNTDSELFSKIMLSITIANDAVDLRYLLQWTGRWNGLHLWKIKAIEVDKRIFNGKLRRWLKNNQCKRTSDLTVKLSITFCILYVQLFCKINDTFFCYIRLFLINIS